MLTMDEVTEIRELWHQGYNITQISARTGKDRKTVRSWVNKEDFNLQPPWEKKTRSSRLDPFKPIIDEWLEEDRKTWHKQGHTAYRVFERLQLEQAK